VKGWNMAGEAVDLMPWQEDAVRALLGWDEGNREVALVSRARGEGKSLVLYTAGRYARARAAGRPLRDDPIRQAPQPRCPRCGSGDLGTETSPALPGEEFLCCRNPDCTWSEL
jgi:hypothetical protein